MIKGNYMTENRKKIYEYLQDHSSIMVTAKDIYSYLNENGVKINLSTIYRNLDRLEKEGTLIKYMSKDGDTAMYQFVNKNDNCDNHLHLQCIKCGKVIHLDCHFMDEITEHISNHHGFDITCKNSIIYGVCKECKEHKTIE